MKQKFHQSVKKIWKLDSKHKLKYYCQMCQKQCRDQHGFDAHCTSQGHMNQMMLFAENKDHYLAEHSKEFEREYLALLQKHNRIDGNVLYQEYTNDPEHMHLNATKWPTLTAFIEYLGREGKAKVEPENGILYLSPFKAAPERKIKENSRTDEERERKNIQKIIDAHKDKEIAESEYTELVRDEVDKKIKLQFKPIVKKKIKKNKILK